MFVKFAPLPVFDQQRAIAFYTGHLGCTVEANAPYGDGGWNWVELGFANARTTLQFERRPDDIASDIPALVLVEPDVAGTVERLRGAGVTIISEPQEAPWAPGRTFAEFRDSEGNRIVIGSE